VYALVKLLRARWKTSAARSASARRLRVESHGADFAETTVIVGGPISDRKGVNVPSVLLPISPLTPKDRDDLDFGLSMGVDWVALSFVQRPEDITEAREIIGKRAWIMAKLEKPAAIEHLDGIVALADGVMVARGDLGVELPPEQVPELQRRIVRACRQHGKPVVVATQMLESMIAAPVPTRAEVSDVATAIYDGVDAVMLSAESASGKYPLEAVGMMDRIVARVEADPSYRTGIDATHDAALSTTADAVCASMRQVAALLAPAATVTYTSSGFTSLRAARERPAVPILSLTPDVAAARRMAMVWGVHAALVDDVHDVAEMIDCACRTAQAEGFAKAGDDVVVVAGLPFGLSGTTNLSMKHATLRQLKVFEAVARHRSFSRAAEELHLTQPAVSTQVRKLEEHAGCRAVRAAGQEDPPDARGRADAAVSREIIQKFEEAEEAMMQFKGVSGGRLNVGVISAGDYFFPRLLVEFAQRHPA
jgi:pyruvate kinase